MSRSVTVLWPVFTLAGVGVAGAAGVLADALRAEHGGMGLLALPFFAALVWVAAAAGMWVALKHPAGLWPWERRAVWVLSAVAAGLFGAVAALG